LESFQSWLAGRSVPIAGPHARPIAELANYLKDLPPGDVPIRFVPAQLDPVLIARGVPVRLTRALGVAWGLYQDAQLRNRKRVALIAGAEGQPKRRGRPRKNKMIEQNQMDGD